MEKKSVGRPTKLTPETVMKLEEVFALDGTVEEACFFAGISRNTYYEWIKENPALNDRFEELRETPVLLARRTVVGALKDAPTAFRYLEKKRKKEFGNAIGIEVDASKETLENLTNILRGIALNEQTGSDGI